MSLHLSECPENLRLPLRPPRRAFAIIKVTTKEPSFAHGHKLAAVQGQRSVFHGCETNR